MSAIKTVNLTKKFKENMAVDNLNLEIQEGELFALLGENGAGKTTTIKMLCCLLKPTAGEAYLLSNSINDENKVKPLINISPQETAVALNLSVQENLELIAGVYGNNEKAATEKAEEMMRKFNLLGERKKRAKTLSGGFQRRLSIAMGLISEPQVLFLDEPSLGLDVRARRELWQCINELKGKITIVLTSHYLEEVEALADRIGIIAKGKLVATGTIEELIGTAGVKTLEDAFLKFTDGEATI